MKFASHRDLMEEVLMESRRTKLLRVRVEKSGGEAETKMFTCQTAVPAYTTLDIP